MSEETDKESLATKLTLAVATLAKNELANLANKFLSKLSPIISFFTLGPERWAETIVNNTTNKITGGGGASSKLEETLAGFGINLSGSTPAPEPQAEQPAPTPEPEQPPETSLADLGELTPGAAPGTTPDTTRTLS